MAGMDEDRLTLSPDYQPDPHKPQRKKRRDRERRRWVELDERLDEAESIRKPLMLHIAGEDSFVPKNAQSRILAGLKGNPMVTTHVYEGVNHAFARPGGKNYNQAAADLANSRTAEFFAKHLG